MGRFLLSPASWGYCALNGGAHKTSEGGAHMSEDENRRITQHEEPKDDVEAHSHRLSANEEPAEEAEDDVEAHGHRLDSPRLDSPREV
jgi:hypothetical protein